jgi:hypothetical protein
MGKPRSDFLTWLFILQAIAFSLEKKSERFAVVDLRSICTFNRGLVDLRLRLKVSMVHSAIFSPLQASARLG